jgi:hypothetical protein
MVSEAKFTVALHEKTVQNDAKPQKSAKKDKDLHPKEKILSTCAFAVLGGLGVLARGNVFSCLYSQEFAFRRIRPVFPEISLR